MPPMCLKAHYVDTDVHLNSPCLMRCRDCMSCGSLKYKNQRVWWRVHISSHLQHLAWKGTFFIYANDSTKSNFTQVQLVLSVGTVCFKMQCVTFELLSPAPNQNSLQRFISYQPNQLLHSTGPADQWSRMAKSPTFTNCTSPVCIMVRFVSFPRSLC